MNAYIMHMTRVRSRWAQGTETYMVTKFYILYEVMPLILNIQT